LIFSLAFCSFENSLPSLREVGESETGIMLTFETYLRQTAGKEGQR